MGSRQRPQLQHRLGPGLQIQTQAQSLHNPNPKPNSKLGLAKTKHKLGLALAQAQQDFIFFPVPRPPALASGCCNFVIPPRWQRRRCSESRVLQARWTAPGTREDLALPGEDGGAAAGYGSGGAVAGNGGVVLERWQRRRGPGARADVSVAGAGDGGWRRGSGW